MKWQRFIFPVSPSGDVTIDDFDTDNITDHLDFLENVNTITLSFNDGSMLMLTNKGVPQ